MRIEARDCGAPVIRPRLLGGSSFCLAALLIGNTVPVGAATPEPGAPESEQLPDEVVVTASRVSRSGFVAPTPMTVVGEEEIDRRAPTNIGDVLNEIPAFRASFSSSGNVGGNPFSIGQTFSDLRGLGSVRTLTLVDGRRHVPTSNAGQVDLTLIPSVLVQRVDVVTGGASAAWGSDAVAGVVNVILNTRLQGVKGDVQFGIAEEGDDKTWKTGLAAGTAFAGGRGHFMLGGEYSNGDGVYIRDRAWAMDRRGAVTNGAFATNGQPAVIYSRDVQSSVQSIGGLITSGPLRGTAFGPGGVPYQFQYGELYGTGMIGGENTLPNDTFLKNPIERYSFLSHVEYDLTDSVRGFLEASYSNNSAYGYGSLPANSGLTGTGNPPPTAASSAFGALIIRSDNAFLPDSVRQQMLGGGINTLSLGRYNYDLGYGTQNVEYTTHRFAGGLSGKLGGSWSWDLYYQYGRNRTWSEVEDRIIANRFFSAIDAVASPVNGAIVCRDTLSPNPAVAALAAGCVPMNLFGAGSPSQQSIDYVHGDAWELLHMTQQAGAVNIQGEPFSTWAGPVSLAVGVEARKDEVVSRVDPISALLPTAPAQAFTAGNPQPIRGDVNVKEGYLETVVPLLANKPFAKSLDLNAAVRETDYSSSGSVTTWKVGMTWDLNDQLRFRGTRSRDIRAPNLNELYTTISTSGSAVIDRAPGASTNGVPVILVNGGNPDLKPEKANTWTVGVIYQPGWFEGFRASVDYYNIDIDGLVGSLSVQEMVDACYGFGRPTLPEACSRIGRNESGIINQVSLTAVNLNEFKTSGVDLEAVYGLPLSRLSERLPGNLSFRLLTTYVNELTTIDSRGTAIDRVDQLGQSVGGTAVPPNGVPQWVGDLSITYSVGSFSGTLQNRYIDGGNLNNLAVPGTATGANINTFPTRIYNNLNLQYELRGGDGGPQIQLFGIVNNLGDVKPPFPLPLFAAGIYHDVVGRAYRIGMRFKY